MAAELIVAPEAEFDIAEAYRWYEDRRFGLGRYYTHLGDPGRRERMLLVLVLACLIATLLGAAGERIGLDRLLRANTVKNRRTHSLFRQGAMLYELIPMMPEVRLKPLIQKFSDMLLELPVFAGIYGVI